MENTIKARRIIKISKKKVLFFMVFVIMIGITFGFFKIFKNPEEQRNYGLSSGCAIMKGLNNNATSQNIFIDKIPTLNYLPIEDNREFLKITYNTKILTRDTMETLANVKNIIKNMDGRIDSINENPKDGYVSFVIPKSNFENFTNELENITYKKLITENIFSSNLLSEKQYIEQQQTTTNNLLQNLEQQNKDLLVKHTIAKNKLQSEITDLENKMYMIDPRPNGFDSETITYRQNLSNQINLKKQQLASENSTYNTKYQNLNTQITNTNSQIQNIEKQDLNFTNNIETVNGYISVNHISLWEMAKIFSPVPPTMILVFLAIVAIYFLNRKNYLPKIEFV